MHALPHQPHLVRGAGEGAVVAMGGTTITYKVTAADTNGAWSLIEYNLPPYYQGTPTHWHAQTLEALYIVQGTLALTLDDHTIMANRGASILVRPGVQHTFFNPTATPVTLLAWFCPGGCEQYFQDLATLMGQEPLGSSEPALTDMDQLHALWQKYDQHHPPEPFAQA